MTQDGNKKVKVTEAKVTWKQKLSFTATGAYGFSVPLGTDAAVGGDEDGFRPLELVAVGLAGCTAMDVISILRKKRQDVSAFEVQVRAPRAPDHPKVFTSAEIDYIVTGRGVEEAAVVRAIELSTSRYCSAHAMFSRIIPITHNYHIYEEGEDGERTLAVSGNFVMLVG